MQLLDERLETIAELVRPGRRAADVGTDHGKLMVHLVESGRCPGGLACDINAMPLEKARTLLARHGLEDKVRCVLCDGLSGVSPREADDVVIAGMGGDLIAHIIGEAPWLRDPEKHLILQPMTKAERLREYLSEEGFEILEEKGAVSNHFAYTILSVRWDGETRRLDDFTRMVGKVRSDDPAGEAYLRRIRSNLMERLEGLGHSEQPHPQKVLYRKLVEEISRRLKEE